MKGYRTLFFGMAVIVLGLLGKHVAPDTINQYLDVVFAGIGIGIVGLRLITTSPIFARVAHDAGLSDDDIARLRGEIAGAVGAQGITLSGSLDALNQSLAAIAGHPLLSPETADLIKGALASTSAASMGGGETSGQTSQTAGAGVVDNPSPASSDQSGTGVATQVASTPAGAGDGPQPQTPQPAPSAQ